MNDDFNFEEPTVMRLVLSNQRKKELFEWCKKNIELDKFDLIWLGPSGNLTNNSESEFLWIFTNKEDYVNFQMSCV